MKKKVYICVGWDLLERDFFKSDNCNSVSSSSTNDYTMLNLIHYFSVLLDIQVRACEWENSF